MEEMEMTEDFFVITKNTDTWARTHMKLETD